MSKKTYHVQLEQFDYDSLRLYFDGEVPEQPAHVITINQQEHDQMALGIVPERIRKRVLEVDALEE